MAGCERGLPCVQVARTTAGGHLWGQCTMVARWRRTLAGQLRQRAATTSGSSSRPKGLTRRSHHHHHHPSTVARVATRLGRKGNSKISNNGKSVKIGMSLDHGPTLESMTSEWQGTSGSERLSPRDPIAGTVVRVEIPLGTRGPCLPLSSGQSHLCSQWSLTGWPRSERRRSRRCPIGRTLRTLPLVKANGETGTRTTRLP